MSATFQITPEMRRARTRANAAQYVAYWPGDQWFHDEYGGNSQWIPPDLGGKVVAHPTERDPHTGAPVMHKADGRRVVQNFYGTIYGKKAAPVNGYWQRPILDKDALIFTAEEIILHLVNKHEARGLVELTGDPEMDSQLQRDAKGKWLKSQREWAQNELNARREVIETYKKEHPGSTSFPPPKESQVRAEIIMLRLEQGTTTARAKYVCDCGMFEHDEKELFDLHRQARHGVKPEVEPVLVVADAEDEPDFQANPQPEDAVVAIPVKRKPGRPRKETTES